jgi:hypothetical protein
VWSPDAVVDTVYGMLTSTREFADLTTPSPPTVGLRPRGNAITFVRVGIPAPRGAPYGDAW